MKCSHCGYKFKDREVVHFKVGMLESYEALAKIQEGRVWVPNSVSKFTIECPKCGAWIPLGA